MVLQCKLPSEREVIGGCSQAFGQGPSDCAVKHCAGSGVDGELLPQLIGVNFDHHAAFVRRDCRTAGGIIDQTHFAEMTA
jgi:hypothetical protein